MNKTNWEDIKEAAEEGVKEGKENIKKFDKFCSDHPWFLPAARIGLIAGAYVIGRKHGVKAGRVEYICDPDIEVIASHGFDEAAHLLDVFDEIKSLSKTKVTKF